MRRWLLALGALCLGLTIGQALHGINLAEPDRLADFDWSPNRPRHHGLDRLPIIVAAIKTHDSAAKEWCYHWLTTYTHREP